MKTMKALVKKIFIPLTCLYWQNLKAMCLQYREKLLMKTVNL